MGVNVEDTYRIPDLARWLSSLPHLNVTLHYVDYHFHPDSPIYLEVRKKLKFLVNNSKIYFYYT